MNISPHGNLYCGQLCGIRLWVCSLFFLANGCVISMDLVYVSCVCTIKAGVKCISPGFLPLGCELGYLAKKRNTNPCGETVVKITNWSGK